MKKSQSSNSSGRVKVCVRSRPLLPRELEAKRTKCLTVLKDRNTLTLGKDCEEFTYDFAFNEHTSQATLFRECVLPLVDGCFSGFNATVFAYGQTGSGKTHTMGSEADEQILPENKGVIPRVIERMFEQVSILSF